MGLLVGIPLGVIAAVNRNRLPDTGVRVFSLVGYAIPDFYLGALLLIVFALNLGWFPINGGGSGFVDRMYHVFLPALTLAMVKTAFLGRLTRTSLLEVLGKDYIRTARAKGARENRVIYRHGLRNALLPVTTGLGLSLLATLSGSVAIELVFNRPGIGEVLISAIAKRDYPVIQGGVVVFAFFVVAGQPAGRPRLHRRRSSNPGEVMSLAPSSRARSARRSRPLRTLLRRIVARPAVDASSPRSSSPPSSPSPLLAPVIAPYDPLAQSYLRINAYPSGEHWLGTDQFGRDVLSRLLYGARNSLIFGLISPTLAAIVGTALGVTAGYFGGIVDRLVTRIIDLLLAFPELLLAIMIAAVLGGGFWNVVAVITVAFVPGFARVARASTLAVKQEPYVEAAIAVGLTHADDHLAPCAPEHLGADRRADDALGRLGHSARGVAQLPRHRHPAAAIRAGATSSATASATSSAPPGRSSAPASPSPSSSSPSTSSATPCATCSIRRLPNDAAPAEGRQSCGRVRPEGAIRSAPSTA